MWRTTKQTTLPTSSWIATMLQCCRRRRHPTRQAASHSVGLWVSHEGTACTTFVLGIRRGTACVNDCGVTGSRIGIVGYIPVQSTLLNPTATKTNSEYKYNVLIGQEHKGGRGGLHGIYLALGRQGISKTIAIEPTDGIRRGREEKKNATTACATKCQAPSTRTLWRRSANLNKGTHYRRTR